MTESCDTNVLLHAVNPKDPFHAKAAAYVESKKRDENFVLCELALMELYVALRNPALWPKPMGAPDAVKFIRNLQSNICWRIHDYPGGLMDAIWDKASRDAFPRMEIFDARLALTLRHFGVTHFATRNVKHFQNYGFEKVFDPTE